MAAIQAILVYYWNFLLPASFDTFCSVMAFTTVTRSLTYLAKHQSRCFKTTSSLSCSIQRYLSTGSNSTYSVSPDFVFLAFPFQPNSTCCPSYTYKLPFPRKSANIVYQRYCRKFSTTPAAKATVITANARKDEEGNDMLIDITARAATVGRPSLFQMASPTDTIISA